MVRALLARWTSTSLACSLGQGAASSDRWLHCLPEAADSLLVMALEASQLTADGASPIVAALTAARGCSSGAAPSAEPRR